MFDSTPHSLTDRLPVWARYDHPVVQRELGRLPPFFSKQGAPLRTTTPRMALLALIVAPIMCGCSLFPWHLLLIPLGWLPLIWAAPVIGHEVTAGRWDMLRSTALSGREIALAKLSAVLYRLLPLLSFMLIGQLIVLGLALLGWIVLISGTWQVYTMSGGSLIPVQLMPQNGLVGLPLMILGGIMLLATLVSTLLDFVTNAVLGTLASALTPERSAAYVTAFTLRAVLTGLYVLLGLLAANLAAGRPMPFYEPIGFAALAGSPGWAMLTLPGSVAGPLLVAVLTLAGQLLALTAILRLTFWQVDRLSEAAA